MKTLPLLFFACLAASAASLEIPAADLHDKIRGGLLGQILGDLNGLPHEMKYIAEPGNVASYTPSLEKGAWTDDDTDIEWVYVLEMERTGTLLLSPARISELWKSHINRRIWCSNLFVRQLMDLGMDPPLTGQVLFNPWADFNLSGQFLSETWGLIAPGMPQTAARMAAHYTRVSIDREPAQAAQMFASMIAVAFLTSDTDRILEAGMAAADPNSRMRAIVADVRQWHRQHPRDWRATRALIQRNYSVADGAMRDRNGVELNGAATVAALLYGGGDFVETVRHAFNFGWDADNNAATSGTILGVIKGHRWLMNQGWNIRDEFRNTSRDVMPTDETITRFGDRLIALAGRVVGKPGPGGIYRIAGEAPANVVALSDPARQASEARARFGPDIERQIAHGDNDQLIAQAVWMAVCLDMAGDLRAKYPERWKKALEALDGYPRLLQAVFYHSDIPGADSLREKLTAAGVGKPPQGQRIW